MDRDAAAGLGALLLLLLGLFVLRPACSPRPVVVRGPDDQLVRLTREAVAMAREAREEAADVRASSRGTFLLALVAAVLVPLLFAGWVLRSSTRPPPAEAEWRAWVRRLLDEEQARLPPPPRPPLAVPPEQDASAPSPE